ncbi:MAG: hypothetical protein HFF00_09600 [Ruminiclostridium sp.]|jgi:hypothetical protein|nr:hypothetical protein [Ruminiclostridium sp.]
MSMSWSPADATLSLQKQLLEAQKLLLKATTPDGAAAPEALEEAVEESLETVREELKRARPHVPSMDRYEPGT